MYFNRENTHFQQTILEQLDVNMQKKKKDEPRQRPHNFHKN